MESATHAGSVCATGIPLLPPEYRLEDRIIRRYYQAGISTFETSRYAVKRRSTDTNPSPIPSSTPLSPGSRLLEVNGPTSVTAVQSRKGSSLQHDSATIIDPSSPTQASKNASVQADTTTPARTPRLEPEPQQQPVVSNPDQTKSAFLRLLTPELVLCITDFLWYPDVFAIGMACRPLQRIVPLRTEKLSYQMALSHFEVATRPIETRKRFCRVCLYRLDPCYFRYDTPIELEIDDLSTDCGLGICDQCQEFRERRAADENSVVSPVWRPSKWKENNHDKYGPLVRYRDRP